MRFRNLVVATAFFVAGISANAQTVNDQVAGAKKAGLVQVGGRFFVRGSIAVNINDDGSYGVFIPFSDDLVGQNILAISTASFLGGGSAALSFAYNDSRDGRELMEYTGGGSQSGVDSDQDKKALLAEIGKPMTTQLLQAGFQSVGGSQTVYAKTLNNLQIMALVQNGQLAGVFQPLDERSASKIKGTVIMGYTEKKQEFGDKMDSAIKVANANFEMTVVADYASTVTDVNFIKDLNDIALADLDFNLPRPQHDAGDLTLGAMNPTDLILKTLTINSSPIDQIEARANKVDGCSSGDPLLAKGESILKVMADDNEKVKKMGLTHQDLALPLLKVYALIEGSFGSKFVMGGTSYSIGDMAIPMCGSLASPFNDHYATAIGFPRVTNMKTNKTLDFSFLHPYLINQYGFYGSHQNRSYVDPQSIVEMFNLKSGK